MTKFICVMTRHFEVDYGNGPPVKDSEEITFQANTLPKLIADMADRRYSTATFNVEHNQAYLDAATRFTFGPIYEITPTRHVPETLTADTKYSRAYVRTVHSANMQAATRAKLECQRQDAREREQFERLKTKFGEV